MMSGNSSMPSSPTVSDSSSDHALGPDTRSEFHDALSNQNMAGGSSRSGSRAPSVSEKTNVVEDPDAINFATPLPSVPPLTRSTALPSRGNQFPPSGIPASRTVRRASSQLTLSKNKERRNSEPDLRQELPIDNIEDAKQELLFANQLEEFKEYKAENEAIAAQIEEIAANINKLEESANPESISIEDIRNIYEKINFVLNNLKENAYINIPSHLSSVKELISNYNTEWNRAENLGVEGLNDFPKLSLPELMIARMLQSDEEASPENEQPASRSVIDRLLKPKRDDLKKIARDAKTQGAPGSQIVRDTFINSQDTLPNKKLDNIISEASKGWLRKNRNMIMYSVLGSVVLGVALGVPLKQLQEANERLSKVNEDMRVALKDQNSRADKAETANKQVKEQGAIDEKVIEGLQKEKIELKQTIAALTQRINEIIAEAAEGTVESSTPADSSAGSQSSLLQSLEDRSQLGSLSSSFWETAKQ
jgi:hypothetical protein